MERFSNHACKDQRKMSSFCPDLGQGQVSFFAPRLIHKMGVLGIDGGFFFFFKWRVDFDIHLILLLVLFLSLLMKIKIVPFHL